MTLLEEEEEMHETLTGVPDKAAGATSASSKPRGASAASRNA